MGRMEERRRKEGNDGMMMMVKRRRRRRRRKVDTEREKDEWMEKGLFCMEKR